ncbi:SufB/SufD family protein [Candidatus Synechococcus spongiarum]|uniref:SufB/SufD family protein n=1 Tax=Candidatus Synechococcus spongiarum TaxID=431041 RepID=UPI0004706B68|nr:SufD family Fe-S cluster assembly protein [Candidatus Synechococcus spongiarum]
MSNATQSRSQLWLETLLQALAQRPGGNAAGQQASARDWRLPTRRSEAWRFTDLHCLTRLDPTRLHTRTASPRWPEAFRQASSGQESPARLCLQLDSSGHWLGPQGEPPPWPRGLMPLPSGNITPGQVARTLMPSGPLPLGAALNGVTPGPSLGLQVSGPDPVHLDLGIRVEQSQAWLAPHVLLVLEPGARLCLSWHVAATARAAVAPMVEARLGPGAQLEEAAMTWGCPEAAFLGGSFVHQSPRSVYRRTSVTWGWGLSRDEPFIRQRQGQAETHLHSLAVARGQSLLDTHSTVYFDGPAGQLQQRHQALADDRGHSVFNGRVVVPRAAQETDASQLSRNLLLSTKARIDTKPQLEIVADNVQCTHGATVSCLQDDELFYLQSRGIGRDQASRLLQRGFCEEILQRLPQAALSWPPLRSLLETPTPDQP